jgi:hypothetical protein
LPNPYKHPIVTAVGLSLLVHLIIVCLLQHEATVKVVPTPSDIDVVQAKLYFNREENALETAEQTTPVVATQQAATQQAKIASMPTVSESNVTVQAKISDQTLEQQLVRPSAQKTAEPALLEEPTQPPTFVSPPTLQSKATIPDSLAKAQIHTFHQGQIDRLAAEAAQSFRQDQAAALIPTNKSTSLLSEEERWRKAMTKNVDCSSSTNQTLVIVTGILGGLLKCTKPPAIDGFIQARLNKGLPLPATSVNSP